MFSFIANISKDLQEVVRFFFLNLIFSNNEKISQGSIR
jgi:hypothetical protein